MTLAYTPVPAEQIRAAPARRPYLRKHYKPEPSASVDAELLEFARRNGACAES